MEFLDEIQLLQDEAHAITSSYRLLSRKSSTLRADLSKAKRSQILSQINLAEDDYDVFRARKVSIDNKVDNHQHPRKRGAFYDLSVYNDGSDDYYPYVFAKTMTHDPTTGFIKKADGDKLITAVKINTQENLEAVPRDPGATRKFEAIQASNGQINEGGQAYSFDFDASGYGMDTERHMFEMMEVYAKVLARDIPFVNFATDGTISTLVTELNKFSAGAISAPVDTGSITPGTLFRGIGPDELVGPYVSQFLLHDFMYGNLEVQQLYLVEQNSNSMISNAGWLANQNGVTGGASTYEPAKKYVYSPRALASIVHRDPLFQFYYNAALVANLTMNPVGFDNSTINSTVWTDGGGPSILAAVTDVALGALHATWYQKYGLTLCVRPEVMAQRIYLSHSNGTLRTNVPKLQDVYDNSNICNILPLVNADNIAHGGEALGGQNYHLNVLYNEGSPTHPSLPAGHAVISGACCTVLKAMITTHDNMGAKLPWVGGSRTALIADATGDNLVSYGGIDVGNMTIVGELNKLASNIAIARNMAGVHYRADGDLGILSGEEYAITYLQDKIKEFGAHENGMFVGFDLEKFDGSRVLIKADEVIPHP